jgi:hypothetical protein
VAREDKPNWEYMRVGEGVMLGRVDMEEEELRGDAERDSDDAFEKNVPLWSEEVAVGCDVDERRGVGEVGKRRGG